MALFGNFDLDAIDLDLLDSFLDSDAEGFDASGYDSEDNSSVEMTSVGVKRKITGVGGLDPRSSSYKMKYCFNNIGGRFTPQKFPQLFAMHLNSGDTDSMRALFHDHMDSRCVIRSNNINFSANVYLKVLEVCSEIHPDKIVLENYCHTRGNQVYSRLYFKFTDVKHLRRQGALKLITHSSEFSEGLYKRETCMEAKLRRALLRQKQSGAHSNGSSGEGQLRYSLCTSERVPEEPEVEANVMELRPLLLSDADLTVQGFMEMRLDVDRKSNTITGFTMLSSITSISQALLQLEDL